MNPEANKQIWENNRAIQEHSKDITQIKERQKAGLKKLEELDILEQRVESLEIDQRLTNDKIVRVCASMDNLADELKHQQQKDHEYKMKRLELEKNAEAEKRDWLFRTVLALIIAVALSSVLKNIF